MTKTKNTVAVLNQMPKCVIRFADLMEKKKMICVRLISGGFRCDMCFQKPYYEIIADDRYNELPAFHLHLCKAHAAQLAKHISDALDFDMKEDER